jgi:hypothetical protein
MSRRTFHLHIDRLVVNGVPAHSQSRFVRALETQLTKLASEGTHEAFGHDRRIASLDAGVLRAGATPEQAAAQVSAALRGGLARKGAGHHA